MQTVLQILTRPEDELTRALAGQQRALPDTRVDVADLTTGRPDYEALLERIFTADSVEVF
jgi:hypothetical protein